MSMTLEKTHQFGTAVSPFAHINYQLLAGSAGSCQRAMWLHVKNSFLNVASGAMTCLGSSNSLVAALDTVDRWQSAADLVWGVTGVRSWIVLKQPGIAPNFQICFELKAG